MINSKNEPVPCGDVDCDNTFTKFRTTDKYCSWTCKNKNTKRKQKKQVRIKPISDKRKKALAEYYKLSADFLNKPENKLCPVTNEATTEVHHKKGRIGYADDWAKLNGITLLIDVRYFLAVSRKGHRQIEENPIWAKKNGYSEDRLSN